MGSVPYFPKALGQRYAQYVNRVCARSGTLWEGRYRSCLVQHDRYLLTCMRYIELNPVRADMVDHPGAYRWSSYRCNAQGEADELTQPHAVFTALDADPRTRAERYRELFQNALEPGEVDQIRAATNGNYALGNDRFAAQPESALSRRVTPGKAGRPPRYAGQSGAPAETSGSAEQGLVRVGVAEAHQGKARRARARRAFG